MNNKYLVIGIVCAVAVVGGVFLLSKTSVAPQVPGDNLNQPAGQSSANVTVGTDTATTSALGAQAITGKMWTVEVVGGQFVPKVLDIKKGDTVLWLNRDAEPVWPASGMHPTHQVYPQRTGACPKIGGSDFDACEGVAFGQSWSFKFDFVGSWKYHDHLNARNFGTINVAE